MRSLVLAAIVAAIAVPGLAQALTLKGLAFGDVQEIRPAEFAALPHVTLKVAIHGKDLRDVVLVTGQDGYQVAYSLGEIDPGTAQGQVLVADRADGAPLDAHAGPFQIVVQNDARPARDARMVARIELIRLGAPPK